MKTQQNPNNLGTISPDLMPPSQDETETNHQLVQLRDLGHCFSNNLLSGTSATELRSLVSSIDARLCQILDPSNNNILSCLNDRSLNRIGRLFILSFIKTILDCSMEAFNIGSTDRILNLAQKYIGSDSIAILGPHMISHWPGENVSTQFHTDAGQLYDHMLVAWIPIMLPVSESQEPIVVPYLNTAPSTKNNPIDDAQQNQFDERAITYSHFGPTDCCLYTGHTLHRRSVNKEHSIFLSCHYRYSNLPVDKMVSHAVASGIQLNMESCFNVNNKEKTHALINRIEELAIFVKTREFCVETAFETIRLLSDQGHHVVANRMEEIVSWNLGLGNISNNIDGEI